MWDKIDITKWKDIPCITGRTAIEKDIENGIAVFSIPSGSEPYNIQLPFYAIQIDEEAGGRIPCVAIQVEKTSNRVFIGVRYLNGGSGVGTLDDFELLAGFELSRPT